MTPSSSYKTSRLENISVIQPDPETIKTNNADKTGNADKTSNADKADNVSIERVTFRVPSELIAEVRAAWWATSMATETRSVSAWLVEAIEEKIAADRQEFNGGQPFEPLGPGKIPTGRR